MRTCIAATRKVSHVFIYKYVYKVSGAHAPLGPTVDTPLLHCLKELWSFTPSTITSTLYIGPRVAVEVFTSCWSD